MSEEFDFSSSMPSEEMAQYLQMFVDETSEQLDSLVEVLLVLETSPRSHGDLNESFRLIHSIKGAAAMMGLDSITLLTHHLENYFERLRSGVQTLDREMMELILKCVDFLRDAPSKLRDGQPIVSSPDLLDALINQESSQKPSVDAGQVTVQAAAPAKSPVIAEAQPSSDVLDEATEKRLIVYFDRNIELPELKAELILNRLRDIAEVIRVSPPLDQLASIVELRTLQVWVRTVSPDSRLRSVAEVIGVELLEIDDVLPEPMDEDITLPDAIVPAVAPVVTVVPSQVTPRISEQDVVPEQTTSLTDTTSKVAETVRVDIQRLDKLMNLAGELVVNRARFVQIAQQMTETFKKSGLLGQMRDLCDGLRDSLQAESKASALSTGRTVDEARRLELQQSIHALEEQLQVLERGRKNFLQLNEAIDQFSRVSDGLQRGVLDTRMVPVGPLFNRFKRTVRDISVELNKKVNIVIRGEKTELDKRMIDELGDPLVHLVRNAIDHGLESESVRKSRNKSEAGTLTLEAVHSGNNVLIYIRDDGGGINIEKVKKRILERGLATAFELNNLSDHDISQFIWTPGFSTADVVSDISGRGVGMDIVKTRIRELNGTVEVNSVLDQGTTFVIRLPLTLAIIRSLLFQLDHGIFAAPIENVREIVSVRSSDVISVHGRNSIDVRGEFIPFIDIEDVFDWHETRYDYLNNRHEQPASETDSINVIILSTVNKKIGLSVTALRGCENLVVKSLDENFTHIRGLAGASILGDGSVCLLLDVVSCIDLAHNRLRDRERISQRKYAKSS